VSRDCRHLTSRSRFASKCVILIYQRVRYGSCKVKIKTLTFSHTISKPIVGPNAAKAQNDRVKILDHNEHPRRPQWPERDHDDKPCVVLMPRYPVHVPGSQLMTLFFRENSHVLTVAVARGFFWSCALAMWFSMATVHFLSAFGSDSAHWLYLHPLYLLFQSIFLLFAVSVWSNDCQVLQMVWYNCMMVCRWLDSGWMV